MSPTAVRQITVAALLLAIVAAIAYFGSLATMPNVEGWYADAAKVPWNPPNSVFGPVWTALYVAIAIIGFLIWRSGYTGVGSPNEARGTLRIYTLQLALNAVWTPIFFAGYPRVGEIAWWAALLVILALLASIIWLISATWKHSRIASWLLVPYLIWVAYASTLNAGIIALN